MTMPTASRSPASPQRHHPYPLPWWAHRHGPRRAVPGRAGLGGSPGVAAANAIGAATRHANGVTLVQYVRRSAGVPTGRRCGAAPPGVGCHADR